MRRSEVEAAINSSLNDALQHAQLEIFSSSVVSRANTNLGTNKLKTCTTNVVCHSASAAAVQAIYFWLVSCNKQHL
jgi:hypothetical protein